MQRSEFGCVVPMHSEIKVGTHAGVLKQAGVSVEEFIGALGQQAMANTDPYLWQKVDSLG